MVDLPDLPSPGDFLPDMPDIGGAFSGLAQQMQSAIMNTIMTVVTIGLMIGIVAVAGYLAWEFFVAPKLAKRQAESIRQATTMMGAVTPMVQGMNPIGGILG